jgi:tetratricopeptide (TPR) repeat protein
MEKKESSKVLIIVSAAIGLLIAVPLFLKYGDAYLSEASPQEQVLSVLEEGIDYSNSLFSPEDHDGFTQQITNARAEIKEASVMTGDEVLVLARIYKDVRDYDKALRLYAIAEEIGTEDLFLETDMGEIYLLKGEPELAAQQFELSKIRRPGLVESYIGLANAYKEIEGTPQYVIDDVYREGIMEAPGFFEIYEAYVDWLEKTDRAEETLPYLEIMNEIAPQSVLEQKIQTLKNKL